VFAQTFQGNGSLRFALGFWLGGARCRSSSGLQERPIQAVTGPDQVVPQGVLRRAGL